MYYIYHVYVSSKRIIPLFRAPEEVEVPGRIRELLPVVAAIIISSDSGAPSSCCCYHH